jgi:hypothetical protein
MATQHLTWQAAFRLFADHLVQFQAHRSRGLDIAQAGAALGISAEAAQGYESTISRLMADLKTDEAISGPARPVTAPPSAAHHINP